MAGDTQPRRQGESAVKCSSSGHEDQCATLVSEIQRIFACFSHLRCFHKFRINTLKNIIILLEKWIFYERNIMFQAEILEHIRIMLLGISRRLCANPGLPAAIESLAY